MSIHSYRGSIEEGTICPISREEIVDPVMTSCGHLFDKEGIKHWLVTQKTCPTCRLPIDPWGLLSTNEKIKQRIHSIRNLIGEAWRHPHVTFEQHPIAVTLTYTSVVVVVTVAVEVATGSNLACFLTGKLCLPTWANCLGFC